MPLNEQTETYEIEISAINNDAVVRQIESLNPNIVYNAAQQIVDFGSVITEFRIKIFQMSAQVGRGRAKEMNIYV
ncbi:MAG: hypothetical protein HRU28_00420 [Rhizobiales bacterium]|nr:hypothetical protein [Hyphomicrobiales bacterium]